MAITLMWILFSYGLGTSPFFDVLLFTTCTSSCHKNGCAQLCRSSVIVNLIDWLSVDGCCVIKEENTALV